LQRLEKEQQQWNQVLSLSVNLDGTSIADSSIVGTTNGDSSIVGTTNGDSSSGDSSTLDTTNASTTKENRVTIKDRMESVLDKESLEFLNHSKKIQETRNKVIDFYNDHVFYVCID
jgi:hypothetical protein